MEKRKHEARELSVSEFNPEQAQYRAWLGYRATKPKTERVPFHLDLEQKVISPLKIRLDWLNKCLEQLAELRKSRPNPKMVNKQECIEELFDLDEEFEEHHEENGPKWSVSKLPVSDVRSRWSRRAAFNNSTFGLGARGARRVALNDQPYEDSEDEVSLGPWKGFTLFTQVYITFLT